MTFKFEDGLGFALFPRTSPTAALFFSAGLARCIFPVEFPYVARWCLKCGRAQLGRSVHYFQTAFFVTLTGTPMGTHRISATLTSGLLYSI